MMHRVLRIFRDMGSSSWSAARGTFTRGVHSQVAVWPLLALVVAGASFSHQLSACPFCAAISNTLAEDLRSAKAAVFADARPAIPPSRPGEPFHVPLTVRHVLHGPDSVAVGLQLELAVNDPIAEGTECLLLALGEPTQLTWSTPLPVSPAGRAYIDGLLGLSESVPVRLKYFVPHLASDDKLLADDAYNEFAKASLSDIASLRDQFDRETILSQLRSPATPVHRRRLFWTFLGMVGRPSDAGLFDEVLSLRQTHGFDPGLDAAMACWLTLGGEEALQRIERDFLANQQSDYADTYSAVAAIRVHGTEWSRFERVRLAQALRQVLARPAVADMVIPDLARWEDWSVVPRVVELFLQADDESQFVKGPVVNYLRACPLPAARLALDQLRQADPQAVEQAEAFALFSARIAPPLTTNVSPSAAPTSATDPQPDSDHPPTEPQQVSVRVSQPQAPPWRARSLTAALTLMVAIPLAIWIAQRTLKETPR